MNASILLFLGVLVGLVSSIPPAGPGALLQVRRGLEGRFLAGMAAGVGGALADGGYCLLAVLGLGYLVTAFPAFSKGLSWGGLVVLLLIGVRFVWRKPPRFEGRAKGSERPAALGRDFLLGFGLTASNPTNLVTWTTGVAIFVSLTSFDFRGIGRFTFPVGVAIGDVAWSAILLRFLTWKGQAICERYLAIAMRLVGVAILALALVHGHGMITGHGPVEQAEQSRSRAL